MSKVVCIAEKPSIAKAIAGALGGGSFQSRRTDNKFIWNYEFAYNSPVWGPCDMTVTAVSGHLTDIKFSPPYDKFDSDAFQLFKAPIVTNITQDGQKIARNIQKLCRRAQYLYIWTDCDREGEHIGGEIANVALKVNSNIAIYRAQFNNTEPSHLVAAAGRPRPLDSNQVEAVNARRELDLRSGFALTRLQTELYRRAFGGDYAKRAVQYGSCQFPTLGFVVERYLKIKNHIAEPFWSIDAKAKAGDQNNNDSTKRKENIPVQWDRNRVYDHMVGVCLYERALEKGDGRFLVTDIKRSPAKRYKPLPLTTVTLQKKASVSLKMSAKRIMELAEKLYNNGYVSYPRTETDTFDESIDLKKLVSKHTRPDLPWGSYASTLLSGNPPKFVKPRSGKHDDKAHPPIHPVQGASRSAITDQDQWKVYEFISRSFLACCSDDAHGFTTNIKLKYGTENFHATGTQVIDRGFLDVYPYQNWVGTMIPDWKIGEKVECTSMMLKEGKTVPPNPLTESELVGLMDANGIGTDATMADHIAKIQDTAYVVKKGQYFEPTPLGIALVMSYDKIGLDDSLTKPFLRKETEVMVSAVANGNEQKADILRKLIAKYETVFRRTTSMKSELMDEAKKHITA